MIALLNIELTGDSAVGVGGVKVSIVAFQAIDPGSIPGRRTRFFSLRDALFSTSLVCRSNWPIRFKSNDIFHYK